MQTFPFWIRNVWSSMLGWTVTFLVLSLVAAYLGFVGLSGLAAVIVKLLLVVFLVLLVASGLAGLFRHAPRI